MSDKTQELIEHSKSLQALMEEVAEIDSKLLEKYGDVGLYMSLAASIGALTDQLDKAGIINKKEMLLESISRRREMLKDLQ
jgi:hypothetical protein